MYNILSDDFMQQLTKEEKSIVTPAAAQAVADSERARDAYITWIFFFFLIMISVQIQVSEKVWVALERDGTLSSLEMKGELSITIVDPDHVNSAYS